jgi:hypothetical protein
MVVVRSVCTAGMGRYVFVRCVSRGRHAGRPTHSIAMIAAFIMLVIAYVILALVLGIIVGRRLRRNGRRTE